jgi:hypothetical protein
MSAQASLHAYLSYRDAPSALGWLQAVGFDVVARQDGDEGRPCMPRYAVATRF